MPRIYQQEDYRSEFEPQAQSERFNPVIAADNSQAIRQQTDDQVQNIQTLARSFSRQAELDSAALEVKQAYNAANFKSLEGLLSLSGTALNTYLRYDQTSKELQAEDQYLESMGFFESDPEPTPEESTKIQQDQIALDAQTQATGEVAKELKSSPDLASQSAAHSIQQNSAFKQIAAVQGNAASAAALHSVYLSEAIRNLPFDQVPKTAGEAQVLLREMNRQYLRATGMRSTDRASQLQLARQMYGNTLNAMPMLVNMGIKMDEQANMRQAQSDIFNMVEAWTPDQSVQGLVDSANKLMAFGNVGFQPGYSPQSNEATIKTILEAAVVNRNLPLIRELENALRIPGQAGTELKKTYAQYFKAAELEIRRGVLEDYSLNQAEERVQVDQIKATYFSGNQSLTDTITALRNLGTEEGTAAAEQLSQFGFNYDPNKKYELMELQSKGIPIPQDQLKQLFETGVINQQEYKQFAIPEVTKKTQKILDDYIKSISTGLKSAMQGKAPSGTLTPAVVGELTIRHQMLLDELRRSVQAEINVNPRIAADTAELSRIVEAKSKFLLSQPQYTLQNNPKEGWSFSGDIKADQRLAPITIAPGVQNLEKLKPEDIFGRLQLPRSELDPTKDYFLTTDELKADIKALQSGSQLSNRTRLFARNLGLSSNAFIDSQLRARGLPSLSQISSQGSNAPNILGPSTRRTSGRRANSNVFGLSGYVGSTNVVVTGFKDYKNRDIKFAPAAANAWKKMISAGMPFNPRDVQNTHRSEQDYLRLIREGYNPSPNGAHNHGTGIDVHGATGEWLKKNGQKYGWVLVEYPGSHGGHFEYQP